MCNLTRLGCTILLLVFFVADEAPAATRTVCASGGCDFVTIQAAIHAAAPGDTIEIVHNVLQDAVHTESGIVVTKNLTIRGQGQEQTIVQASEISPFSGQLFDPEFPRDRVFLVESGIEAVISNLTIRHGAPRLGKDTGGGVLNLGKLTLIATTITRNLGQRGGGVANENGGILTIQQSRIEENLGVHAGGGVSNLGGTLRIQAGSVIHDNKAKRGGGIFNQHGGIIHELGNLFITNSEIRANNAESGRGGGGLYSEGGEVSIDDCIFAENVAGKRANGHGGGIRNLRGELTVVQSNFTENEAGIGGALHTTGGTTLIFDSTFDSNIANNTGGALITMNRAIADIRGSTFSRNEGQYAIVNNGERLGLYNSTVSSNQLHGIHNRSSFLEIINSTIANHREDGTGLHNEGTAEVSNSVIAQNTRDCDDGVTVINPNLDADGSCGFSITGDADLGPLRNNGGPTETHALLENSQAIDEGDNSVCGSAPISGEDQRGVARPQPPGGQCDLGAYETEGLAQQVAMAILFGGQGAGIATWLHGVCETDGISQQGDCAGPVTVPAGVAIQLDPIGGASLGNVNVLGAAHTLVDNQDGTYTLNVEVNSADSDIEVQVEFDPPPTFTLEVQSGGGNGIADVRATFNQMFVINCVVSGSNISPNPCQAEDLPGGAILVIRATAATEADSISAWTDCDPGFSTISPDGQSGECVVTMEGDRLVTVTVNRAQAPPDKPEVVTTIDQTACGGGDFPGVEKLRFLKGVLVAVARVFDAFSNVIQCVIRVDVNTGEGPALMQQMGDMGEFGIVEFFLELGLFDAETPIAHIRERLADDTTIEVLGRFVNDVFEAFLWQGLAVNPTVESFGKIAANDPYFVIQAQFQAEGPGLIAADIAVDPALLAVLFQAGEPVGDGFAFDSFHAGAVPGIALNPLGDGAVVADVVDTTSGTVVDGLLTFRADAPGANLLLRQGQETEFPGVFITRLVNVAMGGDGVIAVLGRVFGTGISSGNDEAVWVCIAALCSIVVQEGMEPEGMPGVRLRFPGSPVVRDGKLLMRTVLEGTGIDSSNNFGLLLVDLATGAVELVGQKGEAFAGDTIADFTSKAFSNNIPLVTVRLNGGFGRALARIEGGGLVPEIVPGDEFTLPDGTVGIVSGIIDITETGGEDGRPGAVGGGGYAIVVSFEDGRSGIVACTAACLEGGG